MAQRAYGGDFQQESSVRMIVYEILLGLLTANRNVTEIFKTPGKLRGKTPRTARKRNPLEVREVSNLGTQLPAITEITCSL